MTEQNTPQSRQMSEQEMDAYFAQSKLQEASADGSMPTPGDGIHAVTITRTVFAKGFNGPAFIIEFTMDETTSTDGPRPGESAKLSIRGFDQANRRELAAGNLKNFLAAAFNVPPAQQAAQNWPGIAKEVALRNICAGKKLRVQTEAQKADKVKTGHKPFVKGIWSPAAAL